VAQLGRGWVLGGAPRRHAVDGVAEEVVDGDADAVGTLTGVAEQRRVRAGEAEGGVDDSAHERSVAGPRDNSLSRGWTVSRR
jgi:hypothetical protein